jgi:hypothetical protein
MVRTRGTTIVRSIMFILSLAVVVALVVVPLRRYAPVGFQEHWFYVLLATLLGASVGASELVSRYRDEPLWALGNGAAGIYLTLNAGISAIAYGLLVKYSAKLLPGIGGDRLLTSFVAGLGAMAILRSRFFVLRSEKGEDIAVGPDAVLTAFLSTADRGVDRARAERRLDLVFRKAEEVTRPELVQDFAKISVAAFQNLTDKEKETLTQEIDRIYKSNFPSDLKLQAISYGILTIFGERNFEQLINNLKRYIEKTQTNNQEETSG